jgi:hypothetical protein
MTLLLKSNDISPYANIPHASFTTIFTNNAGTCTGSRTNASFNINLENLLGEEYNNNDIFKLELLEYSYSYKNNSNDWTYGQYFLQNVNTNLCTKITGLNFINGKSSCLLGLHNFRGGLRPAHTEYFELNTAIFQKPSSPQIVLGLQLFSTLMNDVIQSDWIANDGHVAPPWIYRFRVTPYNEEYENLLSY